MKPLVISQHAFRTLWRVRELPSEQQLDIPNTDNRLAMWVRRAGRLARIEPAQPFSCISGPTTKTIIARVLAVEETGQRFRVYCSILHRTTPELFLESIIDSLDSSANEHGRQIRRLESFEAVGRAGLLELAPVMEGNADAQQRPPPYRSPSASPVMLV